MKISKNRIAVYILFLLHSQLVFGQDFGVNLIKNIKERELIVSAVNSVNKDIEVIDDQIVSVTRGNDKFIVAPIISKAEKNGGCYLQTLKVNYQLGAQYLVERNEDVQRCDAIIAVFGCRLKNAYGLGIIAGIRLGGNHYYSQSSFFDLTDNNELKNNLLFSNKIGSIDSVAKAKNKLGCLK